MPPTDMDLHTIYFYQKFKTFSSVIDVSLIFWQHWQKRATLKDPLLRCFPPSLLNSFDHWQLFQCTTYSWLTDVSLLPLLSLLSLLVNWKTSLQCCLKLHCPILPLYAAFDCRETFCSLSLHATCWWSLWMLFVLVEFAWKREVSAIINPAKIGMILRLPVLSKSNQMVRGTFQDCFISILYITALIPTHEIPGFTWKIEDLKVQRIWLKILNTYYMFLDLFLVPFPPYHLGNCNSFLR